MTDVAMIAPPDDGTDGIGTYTGDLLDAVGEAVETEYVAFPPGSADPRQFLRAAVRAWRSGADVLHVQHEYALFGPVSVLSWLFFPVLFVLSRLGDQRIVVTLHSAWNDETVAGESLEGLKRAYVWATNRLLVAVADRLLFLSANCRESFGESVRPRNAVTLPHGVKVEAIKDIDPAEAKAKFGYEPDETVIVEPGYVREQKGTHRFVDAAERLPDCEFLVAGGAQDESAEDYVENLQARAPENVTITGRLDEDRFHAAFVAADLVCLPYLRMTQSGIFNWAVAYGRPVLSADHEYFRRLASEYDCVELFDPDDTDAIVRTIENVLESPVRREELAENMATVREAHSFSNVAAEHRRLYRELSV